MDHVVYLEAKANELERLLSGEKTMIIRGASGRKMPYGRVHEGDVVYLLNNNAEGMVRARAMVSMVHQTEALTPDASAHFVQKHQPALKLIDAQQKRWAGKRYLILIELCAIEELPPFMIDKSAYGNMDDWLPVGDIATVQYTAP